MITRKKAAGHHESDETKKQQRKMVKITILYGTCTGTSKKFAYLLKRNISYLIEGVVQVKDAEEFDDDDIQKSTVFLLICSTWENGAPPANARRLYDWLQDYVHDFRVNKNHLASLKFAIFGLGGAIYGDNFCKPVCIIVFTFC